MPTLAKSSEFTGELSKNQKKRRQLPELELTNSGGDV
jgi:hypothetical protein